jgi:hypothetical protein
MRRPSLVAFVALLGSLHIGSTAEPPGVVEHGLRLVVSSDKSTYAVGEPVHVRLVWTNAGREELRIPIWRGAQMGETAARHDAGEPTLYALSIYYDGKDRIPYGGVIGCGPDRGLKIPPGETRDTEFAIQDAYDLSRPGRYVVRVACAGFNYESAPPHAWKGLIVYPDIEFTVRAKDEQ